MERWSVEVFFRQSNDKLVFDRYQICSSKGIQRYWLLASLAYLIACIGCGETMSLEDSYTFICSFKIQEERIRYIYQCIGGIILLCNFLYLLMYRVRINPFLGECF